MKTAATSEIVPETLRPEDISIKSIAHALATKARFCGHAIEPYSVAQHSVFLDTLAVAGTLPLSAQSIRQEPGGDDANDHETYESPLAPRWNHGEEGP